MKTMLIKGERTPLFDKDLLQVINVSESESEIDDSDNLIRIGVQNEDGKIYRIIGANDVLEFTHIIKDLHANHWPVENRDPDSRRSLHSVVLPPEEIQMKALGIDPEDPGSAA
ncbi:MAG TPA: hypothetical protein VGU61_07095 [Noviherbaspirillum sp.]|jgi:hypothetical protein|uniref:hypothetical protein n=1 Tax=Noviherbaspirillum sp. TaxID=1926288 RepID=UPI002DDD92E2|nr:hypothetical protein [Noviherbaspirillum sp.]HEV2610017.1 hypothetical protein [Noviherbaspirillum sp.]